MSTTECWRLVEGSDLCRFAIERPDGGPDVFPMNFVVYDGNVYLRSAPGGKLRGLAARPAVALEVDGEEDGNRWSVVLRGAAQRLATDAEIAASGVLHLVSMNPIPKHDIIRVTPRTVSGRRFRVSATPIPPIAVVPPSARVPAPPAETPPAAPLSRAPGKPHPIPHNAPVEVIERPQRSR